METIKSIDDKTVEVDGKRYLLETPEEPKFEVGKWYYIESTISINEKIYRVTSITDTIIQYDCCNGKKGYFDTTSYWAESSVPATKEQIEKHLREVLAQKGFKDGVRVNHMERDSVFTLERSKDWWYRESIDGFHCCIPEHEWNANQSNPLIYSKGKFAEIVNDGKKQELLKKANGLIAKANELKKEAETL